MDQAERMAHGRAALGLRVRGARHSQRLTQRMLAERSGISVTYLSDVELGRRLPTLDVLDRLSQSLSMSVRDMLADPPWANGTVTSTTSAQDGRRSRR
jgi:transcriptional regulator with XRE-family HTH domain